MKRRIVVSEELELALNSTGTFFTSTIVGSSIRGHNPRQLRNDIIVELKAELRGLGDKLRLHEMDKELHFAYTTTDAYIETNALHGYTQMQAREDVRLILYLPLDEEVCA